MLSQTLLVTFTLVALIGLVVGLLVGPKGRENALIQFLLVLAAVSALISAISWLGLLALRVGIY